MFYDREYFFSPWDKKNKPAYIYFLYLYVLKELTMITLSLTKYWAVPYINYTSSKSSIYKWLYLLRN